MSVVTNAMVASALIVLLATAPVAAAAHTYSSGDLSRDLKPRTATVAVMQVATSGSVKDVNVKVRLENNIGGTGALDLYLIAPSGKAVQLSTNNGGSGDDYGTGSEDCAATFTTFDDEASTAIYDGSAPFAGRFRPEQPLSKLDGTQSRGKWRLMIGNNEAVGTGSL